MINFNLDANPISDQGALALYHAKQSATHLQEFMIDDAYAYLANENVNTLISETRRNFKDNHIDRFRYNRKKIQGITFRNAIVNSRGVAQEGTPINAKIVINILIPYFNANPDITALHLDDVTLDGNTIHALITLIQSCKTVKFIKIFDFNPYGYSTIFALKKTANAHSVALSLPFHYRDINNGDEFINRNKSQDANTLDLSSSGCHNYCNWDGYLNIASQDIIDFIIPHLQAHPNITTLILDKNRKISKGIVALAQANTHLTTLSVHECYISSVGMQALSMHNKFVHLTISGNYTADDDLVMIVKNNPKLTTLKAQYAAIGDQRDFSNAVKVIAESQIEELNFSSHQLGTLQVNNLAQSRTLKILNLDGNNLTDDSLHQLASNTSIVQLHLASNTGLTDKGLQQFVLNNKALVSLDLTYIHNAGDLTAIALAQHPLMQTVFLEDCKAISEAGIRALSTNQRLKKIQYSGYNWDNKEFFPLLRQNDPGKNTILPKEKKSLFDGKVDQGALYNLFKVPSLFCLAAFKAKEQAIKKYNSEFTIQVIKDNINLFLTTDMDPKQMKQKIIYLCNQTNNSKPGYQYQLLGEDGKIKRGIIYQDDLPAHLRSHSISYLLFKHIIENRHISLFSENRLSHDVQEQILQYKY